MTERSEARRDGARQQKNSGRGAYSKGDAVWKMFLLDYKEYPKGFRVTLKEWAKVCGDAARESSRSGRDLYPAFKSIMGDDKNKIRLATLEWAMFEELVDKAERYDRLVTERLKNG